MGEIPALKTEKLTKIYALGKIQVTALENVALPLVFAGVGKAQRRQRAAEALNQVGLSARQDHRPAELSGGEQ